VIVYILYYIGTMSTIKESKINLLLQNHVPGTVLCTSWLNQQGYSLDLQKRYKKSGWFDSIGTGALIRREEKVDYLGGLFALQSQLGLWVHPAAKTALSLQGKAHYLALNPQLVQIFFGSKINLPLWFKSRDWGVKLSLQRTGFLPPQMGLISIVHKGFEIKVSSAPRAVMECLYLTPKSQPIMEVYELLEGLNNLRPNSVQQLLESCTSVKVKRLFLYLAEKAGHDWFKYLNLDKIDLGAGKRAIVADGVYIAKYQITVPRALEAMG